MSDYLNPTTWRGIAGVVNNVPIRYRLVSREGWVERNESGAKEVYLIAANQLLSFIFLSYPPADNRFGIPHWADRRMPGVPNLVTRRVSWKSHVDGLPVDPFNVDPAPPLGRNATYHPVLEVTIEYDNKTEEPDENDPETFLTITANAAGEFLMVPSASETLWEAGAPAIGEPEQAGPPEPNRSATLPASVIIPETEWNVRWAQVPRDYFKETLLPRMRDRVGTVNSSAATFLYDAPAETLMFVGYSVTRENQFVATRAGVEEELPPVTVDMKFLEKNVVKITEGVTQRFGHQHVYRPGGGWQRLLVDGERLYEETDMNVLFEVENA